jgi:hypothetical protein
MSQQITGKLEIIDSKNKPIFLLDADLNTLVLRNKAGKDTVWIHADKSNGSCGIDLRNQDGVGTIAIDGEAGDIRLLNADCAEDFDISEARLAEPGTVMVIESEGKLKESTQAYDRKVAGVLSGAGRYKPAMVLDRQPGAGNRLPVALMGKVYCKVDADQAPVEVGDLLTTSATPGHAMKATDPLAAFGAVIGKALRPLKEGKGMIPILIALQ